LVSIVVAVAVLSEIIPPPV